VLALEDLLRLVDEVGSDLLVVFHLSKSNSTVACRKSMNIVGSSPLNVLAKTPICLVKAFPLVNIELAVVSKLVKQILPLIVDEHGLWLHFVAVDQLHELTLNVNLLYYGGAVFGGLRNDLHGLLAVHSD
jgi:hypothetical protein